MSNRIETRNFNADFRAEADYKLVGYVNRYGSESQIMRDKRGVKFVEVIDRGAFTDSIAESANDIYADYNHDESQILGRQSEGTLRLSEDEQGLRAEIQLNADDPQHVSVYQKVKRRDVKGMSFAFVAYEQRERKLGDKLVKRNVTRARLLAVSPVVNPAYETSEVQARNIENMEAATIDDVRDAFTALNDQDRETLLKELSPAQAEALTEQDNAEAETPSETPAETPAPQSEKEKTDAEKEESPEYSKELIAKLKELLEAVEPQD